MKKPCFDKYEREAILEGYKPMIERFKAVKAGRDFERELIKTADKFLYPIIKWLSTKLEKK